MGVRIFKFTVLCIGNWRWIRHKFLIFLIRILYYVKKCIPICRYFLLKNSSLVGRLLYADLLLCVASFDVYKYLIIKM